MYSKYLYSNKNIITQEDLISKEIWKNTLWTKIKRRCQTRTDAHGVSCRVLTTINKPSLKGFYTFLSWIIMFRQSLRSLPTENNLRIEKRRKELYWILTIKQQKPLFFWYDKQESHLKNWIPVVQSVTILSCLKQIHRLYPLNDSPWIL